MKLYYYASLSKKLVMVSIRKFRIIVLVSNIRLEISYIRTALLLDLVLDGPDYTWAQAFASYSLFRYIFVMYCVIVRVQTTAQVFQSDIECSHSMTICVIYVLTSLINCN